MSNNIKSAIEEFNKHDYVSITDSKTTGCGRYLAIRMESNTQNRYIDFRLNISVTESYANKALELFKTRLEADEFGLWYMSVELIE